MTDPALDAENDSTGDDACACCRAAVGRDPAGGSTTDRWIPDSPVLDVSLPGELQASLGRLLGTGPVETLGEWVIEVRRRTGGGPIGTDDLCHADTETGHRAEVDGETYHFLCFYDAVILAALAERPVDIRTESPGGAVIVGRAAGTTDLTVVPENAVFSFGVGNPAQPPTGGAPSPVDVYESVCPYVRAFPHPDAYKQWAATVPAETVAMPLSGATEVAAALAT